MAPEPAALAPVARVPPPNLEAEMAVLGAILQEKEALYRAMEMLRPEHFYRPAHQQVFRACIELFQRNETADLITLSDALRRQKQLEAVGGEVYLTALHDSVGTAANVAYYARIVKEKFVFRELIRSATQIVEEASGEGAGADELLDQAERRIFEIAQDRIARGFQPLSAILKGTFEEIERLYDRKAMVTGVPTGFPEFDQMTGGLQLSDLVIVAGRPGMGKSSFALNVAAHASLVEGLAVGVFSLEMSSSMVTQRLLCAEARVEAYRVRTGRLRADDWTPLTSAASRLHDAKIWIDDSPSMSILELRAKARRLKAQQHLDLLIIDYLQLLRGPSRPESRQQEVADICRSLKSLAKELHVPVVALSQLSRAVEARDKKRPQLADLRESGAIEQDADLVAFIYRPGYYEELRDPEEARLAEVIIGKQRNGPTGTLKLSYLWEYMRFEPVELDRAAPGGQPFGFPPGESPFE
jgi:replicative DNA helicase